MVPAGMALPGQKVEVRTLTESSKRGTWPDAKEEETEWIRDAFEQDRRESDEERTTNGGLGEMGLESSHGVGGDSHVVEHSFELLSELVAAARGEKRREQFVSRKPGVERSEREAMRRTTRSATKEKKKRQLRHGMISRRGRREREHTFSFATIPRSASSETLRPWINRFPR